MKIVSTNIEKPQDEEKLETPPIADNQPPAPEPEPTPSRNSLSDLINQMNTPRIEAGGLDINMEGAPKDLINPSNDDEKKSGDEQYYKTSEGMKLEAEFFMESFDWLMGTIASGISGGDIKNYQRSVLDPKGFERQIYLCAAILNKYQIKASIEAMFIMSLLFGYIPIYRRAFKDRKEVLNAANRNKSIPEATPTEHSKTTKIN